MDDNFLLLTYDSCRYDVLVEASTPVLDSWADILPAQAPANFTYASHQAFFVGLLPNTDAPVAYYNRFCKQLIGLVEVGETNVAKEAAHTVTSTWNAVRGLADRGYQTVGAGAMNWFRQESLTSGFERFQFTGTDAPRQVDFLLAEINPSKPFFGFINFGETHAPYSYEGKLDTCPVDVRARRMSWPPEERGPVGRDNAAFAHQAQAAAYLDRQLPRLLSALPANTIVVLCADHGDCFGEGGYWGHGVNHPKVFEVPLAVFRLDGDPV
jgi:hypothetical protein